MFPITDDYRDPSDCDSDPSVFHLKGLTVRQMYDVDGGFDPADPKPGTRLVKLIKHGLIGWSNLFGINKIGGAIESEISYSEKLVDWLKPTLAHNLADRIYKISVLPVGMDEELVSVVRTSHLKSKEPNEIYWDCDNCQANNWHVTRRCSLPEEKQKAVTSQKKEYGGFPGQKKALKKVDHGGHPYEKCPIGLASRRAWMMFTIIQRCKDKNVLPCEPPVLMEQPYIYLQAESIVEREISNLTDKKTKERAPVEEKSPGDLMAMIKQKSRAKLGRKD